MIQICGSAIHSASSLSYCFWMWESEKKTQCRTSTLILLLSVLFLFSWFVIFIIMNLVMNLILNSLGQHSHLQIYHEKCIFIQLNKQKCSLCAIVDILTHLARFLKMSNMKIGTESQNIHCI